LPDFSLCKFEDCKKSQNCLRFLAKPNMYQSWEYEMENICNESNGYEYFIEVKRLKKVV